jgi:hypothetical protein
VHDGPKIATRALDLFRSPPVCFRRHRDSVAPSQRAVPVAESPATSSRQVASELATELWNASTDLREGSEGARSIDASDRRQPDDPMPAWHRVPVPVDDWCPSRQMACSPASYLLSMLRAASWYVMALSFLPYMLVRRWWNTLKALRTAGCTALEWQVTAR